jgi:hypothetical protein
MCECTLSTVCVWPSARCLDIETWRYWGLGGGCFFVRVGLFGWESLWHRWRICMLCGVVGAVRHTLVTAQGRAQAQAPQRKIEDAMHCKRNNPFTYAP